MSSAQFDYKYIYDDVTKEFLRTQEVEYDHRNNEVMYPCETRIEPPQCQANEVQVFNPSLARWDIVEDHRGREVYINGKEWTKWTELGPLPANVTTEWKPGAITLVDAKATVCSGINKTKDRIQNLVFEYNGSLYQSDIQSFQTILGYEAMARNAKIDNTPFNPVPWITYTNSEILLTGDDFIAMVAARTNYISKVHEHATALKAMIRGIIVEDGHEDITVREREAIDKVENIDVTFKEVLPLGVTV